MEKEPEHKKEEIKTEHHEHSHKESSKNLKKNPWMLSTVILGVVLVALLIVFIVLYNGTSGKVAGENFVNFINERGGTQIEYIESSSLGPHLYEVTVSTDEGNEIPVYLTKDGKYFVQLISVIGEDDTENIEEEENTEIVKSDNPTIQLFVMTHCPYGTQAEKGLIPVIKYLGDSADVSINFVHYFMHDPEYNETPRQVCIREEQSDKWIPYLECFLEDGDSARCIEKVGINEAKLDACISSGKSDEYYNFDAQLSESSGVQGSPTLVINGEIVSSGRSPAAFLDTICQAFNNPPELCSGELSSETPGPGFGYDTTSSSSSSAQC